MKSAEEYVKGSDRFIDLKTEIKQIQLDAMKEGARRAAETIHSREDMKQRILTTANQWTLNDL